MYINVQGDHQTVRHIDVQLCHNLSAPLGSSHAVTDNGTWDADVFLVWWERRRTVRWYGNLMWKISSPFSSRICSTNQIFYVVFHWRALETQPWNKDKIPPWMYRQIFFFVLLPCWSLSRCWFQIFFIFIPNLGEDEPILTSIFSKGFVQPPTS